MLETDDYFKNNKLTKHLEFKELSFVEKYLHIQFLLNFNYLCNLKN